MPVFVRPKRQSQRFLSMRIFANSGLAKSSQIWLNVTALVDMMTVLVIFLIMQMSTSPDLLFIFQDLIMPKAQNFKDLSQAPVISLTRGQDLYFEGNLLQKGLSNAQGQEDWMILSLKEKLVQALPKKSKEEGKKKPLEVNVQIDEGITFSLVKRIIHTCEQAGYENIRFSVLGAS